MRLLDMAKVHVGNGQWMKGWQAEDRMPGLGVEIFDICGPTDIPVIEGDSTKVYEIRPFGIKAGIPRSLLCGQDDDENWLGNAVKDTLERAVGLAACVNHAEGTETWIGDNNVIQSARGAGSTIEIIRTDILNARKAWLDTNTGTPTLHVADDILPVAMDADVVYNSKGELVTIWGDPVVNSPGYLPGVIFWSGPIEVHVSSTDTDLLYNVRNNSSRVIANLVAVLDMSPHQIVRIGPAPAAPTAYEEDVPAVLPETSTAIPAGTRGEPYVPVPLGGFETEPTPEPEPEPEPTPDSTWLKADILAWLQGRGVTVEGRALTDLTKAELLSLVNDVLSPAPIDG